MAHSQMRGFTIMELMIVVAIMGILASLAFPAFGDLIKNSRRTTVVNEVSSSLMYARAEAAKRGSPVSVCGMNSAGTDCSGDTNWDRGLIVFLDTNANGALDSEQVFRKYAVEYADLKVRSNAGGAGQVTLQPFNRTSTVATLTICDKRGASRARAVTVAGSGRAAVVVNNVEDPATGSALTCP